jgi:hypothetical protein
MIIRAEKYSRAEERISAPVKEPELLLSNLMLRKTEVCAC